MARFSEACSCIYARMGASHLLERFWAVGKAYICVDGIQSMFAHAGARFDF